MWDENRRRSFIDYLYLFVLRNSNLMTQQKTIARLSLRNDSLLPCQSFSQYKMQQAKLFLKEAELK